MAVDNDSASPRFEAVWDPESLWWAVSDGDGCWANGLIESEARALAADLTEQHREDDDTSDDGDWEFAPSGPF